MVRLIGVGSWHKGESSSGRDIDDSLLPAAYGRSNKICRWREEAEENVGVLEE